MFIIVTIYWNLNMTERKFKNLGPREEQKIKKEKLLETRMFTPEEATTWAVKSGGTNEKSETLCTDW